jgi:hypothetical protein
MEPVVEDGAPDLDAHPAGAELFPVRAGGYRARDPIAMPATAHPGYAGRPLGLEHKLAGVISWLIVAYCLWGVFVFPGRFSVLVTIVMCYLLVRMVVTVVFSLYGDKLARDWERRDWSTASSVADLVSPRNPDPSPPFADTDVHHVVLVPNYKEPQAVLEATVAAVARQRVASRQVTLVLAMEAKEAGAEQKAAAVAEMFAGRFANILVTMHPGNMPGEIACKGSNQAWAAREAKRFVVDQLGIDIDRVTVTSCDADSILNDRYLDALGPMYVADRHRHAAFWQAPLLYYNNLWDVPFPVRFMAYITNALLMADLANPLTKPLPISTYTLSLRMLHETGYWDPAVISEDWHIYLQCYFARHGDVRMRRIILPTSADMPDGDTAMGAIAAMYHQAVRHSWGAEDIGYILQQWRGSGVPALPTTRLFWHVLRDHILRSVPWFLFTAGSVLSFLASHGGNPMLLHQPWLMLSLNTLWLSSSLGLVLLLASELRRFPPPSLSAVPGHLLGLAVAWIGLPVITLAFGAIPALYAQSKLMLGLGLSWRVTPKRIAHQMDRT